MSFQEIAKYLSKSSAFTDNTNNVSQMLHTMETINQASLRKNTIPSMPLGENSSTHTINIFIYACITMALLNLEN